MPIVFADGATGSVQSMKGGQYLLLGGIDPNASNAYYGPYIIDSYNVGSSKNRYLEINPRSGQEYIQISSGTAPVTNYIKVDNGNITMTASSTIGIFTGTLTIGGTNTTLSGSVNMTGSVNSTYQSTATVSTTNATPTALVDVATTTNSAYVVWWGLYLSYKECFSSNCLYCFIK